MKNVNILPFNLFVIFFCFSYSMNLRLVYADGTVAYENGDLTPARALSSHCQCGYKHWRNGKEYDNPPDMVGVKVKHS